MKNVPAIVKQVVKGRSLVSYYRDKAYPAKRMPFYLYGSKTEQNIDHILLRAPNIQLTADGIKPSGSLLKKLTNDQLASGVICCIDNVRETAMQPFPIMSDIRANPNFFFKPGKKLPVTVYRDAKKPTENGPGIVDVKTSKVDVLATGTLTLGDSLYIDREEVNGDPYKRKEKYVLWKEEFDKIGQSM